MRRKIVLLPLDERPCNFFFPEKLFSHGDYEIVCPERLGDKKLPADFAGISDFLTRECSDADGLVISLDMLLYGGLIPSRLHHETEEQLQKRLELVKEIRQKNKKMKLFAFQVIMRCPAYSSSDEEPDYYEWCGKEIHEAGSLIHKRLLGMETEKAADSVTAGIDNASLDDFLHRRQVNRNMNIYSLRLVEEGIVDALVIPQDDSARFGYAAMDQQKVREEISERKLTDRVLMYPGADEVGLTLISRMINELNGKKPKVYVKYASEQSKSMIPSYEGAALSGTIRYQLLSAGCQLTESYEHADFSLLITAPSDHMESAADQPSWRPEYYAERNLAELIDFIKERKKEGGLVSVADNAYANGGDLEVIRLLDKNGLLFAVDGYAGWNTSANTLGTAIAEAVDTLYSGKDERHIRFMAERYVEDAGYCAVVRKRVTETLAESGMNYFDVKERNGVVSRTVKSQLEDFVRQELGSIASALCVRKVSMPWRRMFEVDVDVEVDKEAILSI